MLTTEIVKHIIFNSLDLCQDTYLISDKFSFTDDDISVEKDIWCAQTNIGSDKFKILLCQIDENEVFLISFLETSVIYGCYLNDKGSIYYCSNDTQWHETNTYLQATYLAGMESLKDMFLTWDISEENELLVNKLKQLAEIVF